MPTPSCPLARSIGAALAQGQAYAPALVVATDCVSVSAPELRSWIAASVMAIDASTSRASASLVLALALPSCSIEESACMLLVASQPRWVFVPLDMRLPPARLREILTSVGADGLITWDKSEVVVDDHETATALPVLHPSSFQLCFYKLHESTSTRAPWLEESPRCPLYVLGTSGTTGQSKGVVGTRIGAFERVEWTRHTLPMESQRDAVLRTTRLTFVDAVAEILGACLDGVPLVHPHFHSREAVTTPFVDSVVLHAPRAFVDTIAQWRVTRFTVVPSVLRVLLHGIDVFMTTRHDETREPSTGDTWLTSLQVVQVSGEPLPLSVVDQFFRLLPHVTLVNFYGSTEVSGDVSWKTLRAPLSDAQREKWQRLGVPIGDASMDAIGASTRIRLERDSSDKASPTNPTEELEVVVSGGAVATGYLIDRHLVRPPEKWVREHDGSEWFHMGGLCRIVDGELFLCGRRDRQVKIRGNRLQLEDAERALKLVMEKDPACADVLDGIVLALETRTRVRGEDETSLVAVLVVRSDEAHGRACCDHCPLREIEAMAKRRLYERLVAEFGILFVPQAMVALPAADISRLSSGKIDYRQLGEMYQRHSTHAPTTTTQGLARSSSSTKTKALVLVHEMLKLPHGLPHAELRANTWLQLGGNSLQATLLSWEIQQQLNKSIPPHEIVRMEIGELLDRISSKKRILEEDAEKKETDVKVLITSRPKTKRIQSTQSRSSLPPWVWYSRYNRSSMCREGQVPCLPSTCGRPLPATANLTMKLITQRDLGKCIDASPLIVRRQDHHGRHENAAMVLVGSHSGQFMCLELDLLTHKPHTKWTQTLDDRIEATATCSGVHSLVFIGTYSGCVYALGIDSGEVQWTFQASGMIKSGVVVIEALELVVVGAYDQRLYALDMTTGAVVWTAELLGSVFSTPVFVESTSQLIVATTTGVVVAQRLATRNAPQRDWETTLPAPVFASLVVAGADTEGDAHVLIGCADGVVYALNLSTGTTTWSYSTRKPIFCTPCVYQRVRGDEQPSAIVGSHDGRLRKISTSDGTLVWDVGATDSCGNDAIFASPYVAALPLKRELDARVGVVCAARTDGRLVFLDELTGHVIPSTIDGAGALGEIFSSPVIVDDLCFVGTRTNHLLVFHLEIRTTS